MPRILLLLPEGEGLLGQTEEGSVVDKSPLWNAI